MGCFKVKNNIALTATVCIALFKATGELLRERLRQSRVAAFSWNGQARGQFLQAKPHNPPHRAWLVVDIFCTGEVSTPRGG